MTEARDANSPTPALRVDLDDEGGAIYGTREGYAALAAALLRAVDEAPPGPNGHRIAKLDLKGVLTPDSDEPDFTCYVTEKFPPRPARADSTSRLVGIRGLGCLTIIGLIILLAAVGVGAIVNYFFLS